ncbi:MAG: hypothetical protein WBI63_08660, partial [Coriobacteriia bacterium]
DIYGDPNNPSSRGGLCAKGAGSYQLVNNVRRLGVPEHLAYVDGFDFTGSTGGDASGVAWKRIGDGAWAPMGITQAWNEVAAKLVELRNPYAGNGANAKAVQFLGCSHMNNEQNYLYRKIIANFGTSQVEHQARI